LVLEAVREEEKSFGVFQEEASCNIAGPFVQLFIQAAKLGPIYLLGQVGLQGPSPDLLAVWPGGRRHLYLLCGV
jgi:hypothetical protein